MDPTISSLIAAAERGDRSASETLFTALYSELHRMAKRELARHGVPVSLGATTLLHQAYLDIAARDGPSFPDRARFMGYAARVMRGLIIDHARERHAQKRGGLFEITSLDTNAVENAVDHQELVRISETLEELAFIYIARFALICRFEESMFTLSPDQWQALSPYLDQALAMSDEERAAW